MALLLRSCLRPGLNLTRVSNVLQGKRKQMGTTAQEQMKAYWEKNQKLGRPNSPWLVYHWHLPMCTSLCHRVTGVVMGVALYGIAVGLAVGPYDFATYLDMVKSWDIPKPILFTLKTLMAFPLCYHSVNGMRHLSWDYGVTKMFLLSTQYKSGTLILAGSILTAMLLASLSYL